MRISFNEYCMEIAHVVSKRSTCARRPVGAVAVDKYGHIISTGFNGVPSGVAHCIDNPCFTERPAQGELLDECKALHAEQNLITHSVNPMMIKKVFVTLSPCMSCAKLLAATKVETVYYDEAYNNLDSVKSYLHSCGIMIQYYKQ